MNSFSLTSTNARPSPWSRFSPRSRTLRVWPAWSQPSGLPSYKKNFASSAELLAAHGHLNAIYLALFVTAALATSVALVLG